MRNLLLCASCLLLSCVAGCVGEEPLPNQNDAAIVVDAGADDGGTMPPSDLGATAADGAVCGGDSCAPFCVATPDVGPAPTFACDAEHEGDVECGDAGCGYVCMCSCWIPGCDGPCGGLDAGG